MSPASLLDASTRPLVWLLEDSFAQAEMTVAALSSSFEVVHFPDSAVLLEALQAAQPDVLVLDWEVPEISGLEVLRVLRMTHDRVALPVVMLTARGAQHELVEAFEAQANDFAAKPYDPLELTARVSTLAHVSIEHRHSLRVKAELQSALEREESARRSEHDQRLGLYDLFMQAPVAVALLRGSEQVCEYVNLAFQKMIGAREMVGKPLLTVLPELAQISVPQLLERIYATGTAFSANELGLQRSESAPGQLSYYNVNLAPRRNRDKQIDGILVVVADVTEQVQARLHAEALSDQMRVSEAELRAVTDALPVLVSHVTADERYGMVNRAYESWFGVTREELLGRPVREVIGEAAYAVLAPYVKRGLAGERFSFEQHAVPYRLGGTRDVRVDFVPRSTAEGARNGYVALLQDVTTDRRAARERELLLEEARRAQSLTEQLALRLQQSQQQMRNVVEAAGAGLWSLDLVSNEIEVNERASELMGLPAGVKIPLTYAMTALHPDDAARVAAAVDDVCSGATPRYLAEYRVASATEARWRWIESRASLFDNGRPQLAGTMIDITERKQLDSQREQSRALEMQLRQAAEQANRSKDEFMAMLGHELRNPLAPILTALELMRARGRTELRAERALIERQARHMERLVEDLLDVSRIATGKVELRRERIELAELLDRAVETAQPLIREHRHELSVHVAREGLLVNADAARMTQVFANLLRNAAKYTDPGGKIRLQASPGGAEITVEVIDSGRGIAPDMLPRVFELFSQESQNLDRSQGGLGLGLAIVKSLSELHGGRVSVRSDGAGKGSTFSVSLPVAGRGTPSQPALTPVDLVRARARPVSVLVVDDNEDAAFLMSEALTLRGCSAACVHDAQAALEAVRREPPEVAVLDIGLPGMDGYQLAQKLREQFGDEIRLVALTGYGQPEDRRRSSDAGFDLHLVKPASIDVLYQSVQRLAASAS